MTLPVKISAERLPLLRPFLVSLRGATILSGRSTSVPFSTSTGLDRMPPALHSYWNSKFCGTVGGASVICPRIYAAPSLAIHNRNSCVLLDRRAGASSKRGEQRFTTYAVTTVCSRSGVRRVREAEWSSLKCAVVFDWLPVFDVNERRLGRSVVGEIAVYGNGRIYYMERGQVSVAVDDKPHKPVDWRSFVHSEY
jgi:hypothetical protein